MMDEGPDKHPGETKEVSHGSPSSRSTDSGSRCGGHAGGHRELGSLCETRGTLQVLQDRALGRAAPTSHS
jgi:hypothetical protein